MAKTEKPRKRPIEQYEHKGKKRVNNPPVGLVTPDTDPDLGKKTYAYDPHLTLSSLPHLSARSPLTRPRPVE